MQKGMKFMALGFVVLGVVLAWLAFMVSGQPRNTAAAPVPQPVSSAAPVQRVVVARRAMAPGEFLTADDVQWQDVSQVPADAVSDVSAAIGRGLAQPVAQGDVIASRSLLGGISGMLQPGERAVAIKVDESTAVGHKVQPGDWVDVLVVFRKDGQEVSDTQARRLLERKRILAYGLQTEPARSALPGKDSGKDVLGHKLPETASEQVRASNPARTAVLAVQSDEVNPLLLAERQGQVMLALRSSLETVSAPAQPVSPAAEAMVLTAAIDPPVARAAMSSPSVLTLERLTTHGASKAVATSPLAVPRPVPVPLRQVTAPSKPRPAATGVPVEFIRGVRAEMVHY